jgi:hypothetical protein
MLSVSALVRRREWAYFQGMKIDPVVSNPGLYSVIFENDRVRVLRYVDSPGQETVPHDHPESVMITQTEFRRKLVAGENSVEVELPAGTARWLTAQRHSGENIGETETRCIFVELKEPPRTGDGPKDALGPSAL